MEGKCRDSTFQWYKLAEAVKMDALWAGITVIGGIFFHAVFALITARFMYWVLNDRIFL